MISLSRIFAATALAVFVGLVAVGIDEEIEIERLMQQHSYKTP